MLSFREFFLYVVKFDASAQGPLLCEDRIKLQQRITAESADADHDPELINILKTQDGIKHLSEMSKRNSSAVARLKQDYIRLKKDPVLSATYSLLPFLVQFCSVRFPTSLQSPSHLTC